MSWRSRQRAATAGFTLLELMLALALLAVLMVILFGAVHAVATSKIAAERRLKSDEEARNLIWLLGRELHGAVYTPMVPSHVLLIGSANKQGGGAMDSITFSTFDTLHRRALDGFSAEEVVSYSAVPNPDHPGWYELVRSQQSALLPANAQAGDPEATQVVLARDILSLHLRYYNGNRWLESWNSTQSPPGQFLPQAISIHLVVAGGLRPTMLSTTVELPMAVVQR